jgi:hypothetical protein
MSYSILLVQKKGKLGNLVSAFTGSDINHVAFEINGIVYEQTTNGIVWYFLSSYEIENNIIRRHSDNLPKLNHQRVHDFVKEINWTRYDWLRSIFWIFRMWIKKDIKTSRLNCVEFVEHIFIDQGTAIFNRKNLSPKEVDKFLISLY